MGYVLVDLNQSLIAKCVYLICIVAYSHNITEINIRATGLFTSHSNNIVNNGICSRNFNRFNILIFIQNNLHDQLLVVYMSKIYNNDKITRHRIQWHKLARVKNERPSPIISSLRYKLYNYLYI